MLSDGTYLVMEQGDNNLSPSNIIASNAKPSNDSQGVQLADEDIKQLILQQQRSISVQPQTVKWLLDNYESAEGVSLPRSALYHHYNEHCQENRIEPVNAASFGKLIRSVFIGLRTRRLGTRGNSKYHYYGIRIKPGSTLAKSVDPLQICNNNSSSNLSHSSPAPSIKKPKSSSFKANSNSNNSNCVVALSSDSSVAVPTSTSAAQPPAGVLSAATIEELKIFLGDPTTLLQSVWPDVPTISSNDADSPNALLNRFAFCYRRHYEQVINAIGNLQFSQVEQLWTDFWQSTNCTDKEALSLDQLHRLTIPNLPAEDSGEDESFNSLANWIVQTDYTLYNSLITSLLLPNLLKPIPQQLTQQIRNFAKNMVNWMKQSLAGYDATFVQLKCSAVSAFSHTLRRYTSLNHLSSAARSVLQNGIQVQQMISDLGKVDFRNLQEQANWGCDCEEATVDQIENSFKLLLQEPLPAEKWPIWCEQIIDLCLQVIRFSLTFSSILFLTIPCSLLLPQENHEKSYCRKFYFIWKMYTSLVMRDLTLRSASSFGSFHLIHLLFDEYIFYLIEHRVAKASNKTSLQILQEVFAFIFRFSSKTTRLISFSFSLSPRSQSQYEKKLLN